MTKAKAQVASATTLSAQQAVDNEDQTSAEAVVAAEEAKDITATEIAERTASLEAKLAAVSNEEQEKYIASMEAQLDEMSRVVATVVKGKAPPKQKKPRPAGMYRLKSPYWDGRVRHEVGKELRFAKDKAPQSAKPLG